jgi:endonuclease/exonuclease/phosphatase family metal-dependent hydrolase
MRDGVDVLAPIFYGLPPAVLAVLAIVAALMFANRRQTKRSLAFVLIACGCSVYWTQAAFCHNAGTDVSGSRPILFWNMASRLVSPKAVAQLRDSNAEIMGMVEAGDWQGTLEWYAAEFPAYQFAHFGNGMVIGTRSKILHRQNGPLGGFGNYALVKTNIGSATVTVILVDVKSNPFRSRRPAFEALANLIRAQGDAPLVVMGDFNTPGDSVWFDPLRREFRDAFETAGQGLMSTWPVPAPVLAIDHIWLSRHFDVHQARLGWSPTSDHRPVITKVSVAGDRNGPAGLSVDR